jgi:hypothetical protein
VSSIDAIGGASHDAVEALRLRRRIDMAGKRRLGVDDGFDSTSSVSLEGRVERERL